MILITFDIISLVYVYGSRMYIVSSFMKNLNAMFPNATDGDSLFNITSRLVYTIVMNSILFVVMLVLLGLQIYHENLDENKPEYFKAWEEERDEQWFYVSYTIAYMVLATIVVPLLSIVTFILANYYYILELMIKINMQVLKNSKFRSKLEDYGDVAQGIMGFATKNVHATPGRLRDIQTLSTFQRVFYVLREWWIDLVFFLYASALVLYAYFYYEYISRAQVSDTFFLVYLVTFVLCLAMFIMANYHTYGIVMITNILIIPLLLSFAIQTLFDKMSSMKSGKIDAEKKLADSENTLKDPISTDDVDLERPESQLITVRSDRNTSMSAKSSSEKEGNSYANLPGSVLS